MKLYGSVALQGCGSSQRVTMERAITCADAAMKAAINAKATIIVSYSEWLARGYGRLVVDRDARANATLLDRDTAYLNTRLAHRAP